MTNKYCGDYISKCDIDNNKQRLIRQLIEDVQELQYFFDHLHFDKLNDQQLIELSSAVSKLWLMCYLIMKEGEQ